MASDAAFFEVLEADLRALSSEARRTDSLATQITGWLQHTDFPQIKECAERALLKLRAIAQEGKGVEAVRTKEILRPFLLVCESKNPRLIGAVLGSIQKLLAHNAVSDEGRQQVIQALHQVERSSDDTVKLKILQTALTMLQNSSSADDQEGAGQVLSLCIRIYCHNKSSPTVVSTAAATIRQAVALLFDHAVEDANGPDNGVAGIATAREVAAVLLLQDLMNMCAGYPPTWLKCPLVGRPFVLDLLEFVLLHRPAAFHFHSAFKALLQNKVGPCLADLSRTALDPEVEPASAGEAKLLLRCVGALLRKHVLLLPDLSASLIETLLAGCKPNRMPWQRLLSLQVLRWLMVDPYLLYALFTSYDMSIHHDTNAVHDTLNVMLEIVKAFSKLADSSDEDMIGSLSAIFKSKLDGKELQLDVDNMTVAHNSSQEVMITYLALEVLLAVVSGVETLVDAVNNVSKTEHLQLVPLAVTATIDRCRSESAGALLGLQQANSMAAAATGGSHTPKTPLSGSRHSPTLQAMAQGPLIGAISRRPSGAVCTSLSTRPSMGPSVLSSMSGPQPSGALQPSMRPPVASSTVSTLVDVLWRPLLAGLSGVLRRCTDSNWHEALILQVLRAYQSYTYSAGGINEVPARDAFLAALCEVAITVEKAEGASVHAADTSQGGTGARADSASSALLEDTQSATANQPLSSSAAGTATSAAAAALLGPKSLSVTDLKVKNIHALRILFNCAYRLADVLGSSWVLVVEVLCILDRAVPVSGQAAKVDDTSSGMLGELMIILTIANQLFEQSSLMSPDAQVSLMLALSEVSSKTLAAAQQQGFAAAGAAGTTAIGGSLGGAGMAGAAVGGIAAGVKLTALNRMVEVLLFNLPRIQNLWGIFLAHLMEVLHNGNTSVRSVAIEALDRSLTGAIASPQLSQQGQGQGPQSTISPRLSGTGASVGFEAPSGQTGASQRTSIAGDTSSSGNGAAEDVEHMLLVALESMYKEEREPDVRLGLLRVALHVLQRHGESLTRGWVPLLRLLEAVPAWEESNTISAAFLCVEAISSDLLPTMPKQHLERAFEVIYLFAAQKSAINISLSAIGLLWNATDLLGRSRSAATAAAAATATASQPATPSGLQSALSTVFSMLTRKSSKEEAITAAVASVASSQVSSGSGANAGSTGKSVSGASEAESFQDAHVAGRSDLSENECTDLLLRLFTHLRNVSMDPRPEVRNSGVRSLFLAVGGQASLFHANTWAYCMWEVLFPLVTYVHVMGDTSSREEAAAVELGKEKGKSVMMLVHHSRNTEQKQWDETTVIALNGLGKVLKANMATIVAMPGFDGKWDDICDITARMLSSGRKTVAIAAAQLLTSFLQSFKTPLGTAGARHPWKRALSAIDEAVTVMAAPQTRVPMQARTELLTGLSGVLTSQQGQDGNLDLADIQMLLRWMDALARNPVGTDDVTPVPGVLPPVQKLVLQVLGHVNAGLLPDAWPEVLRTLAGFLCPFRAMQQRRQQEGAAANSDASANTKAIASDVVSPTAAASAAKPASAAHGTLLSRGFARLTSPRAAGSTTAATSAAYNSDASMLSHQWMGKIVDRIVVLYSHAPWQVRATLFAAVVAGLGECAALRHLAPDEPLWRQAAAGLVSVINAGLPAVNIMFVNHHQPPENAWQVVADTFEQFLLGWRLPEGLVQQVSSSKQQGSRRLSGEGSVSGSSRHRSVDNKRSSKSSGSQKVHEDPEVADSRLQALVLDNLTDVVLASCSSAAHELRARLVRVVAGGAASTAGHTCCNTSCSLQHRQTAVAYAAGAEHKPDTPSNSESGPAAAASTVDGAAVDGSTGEPVAAPDDAVGASARHCVAPSDRFSQMCLRKLALLAGRGTEGSAGSMTAVMLEVAQIALPLLLDRCAQVLLAYAEVEEAATADEAAAAAVVAAADAVEPKGQAAAAEASDLCLKARGNQADSESSAVGNKALGRKSQHANIVAKSNAEDRQQQHLEQQHQNGLNKLQLQHRCLVEEVTCVLQVLIDLQLDAIVLDEVLEQQPQVAACLHIAHQVHMQQHQHQFMAEQQQQHLPLELQSVGSLGSVAASGASAADGSKHEVERQQGHLLLLYELLARCVGCRDRSVTLLLRQALLSVGKQLFA